MSDKFQFESEIKMFDRYAKLISEMNKFEKEDILNKKFELYSKSNMKIFYAPHNEIINKKAKVFIVGITPGWTQTSIAYKTAHEGLLKGLDYEQIKKECNSISCVHKQKKLYWF